MRIPPTWGAGYDSAGLEWGLRVCISNQLQSNAVSTKAKCQKQKGGQGHQRSMGGGEAAKEEGAQA